MSTSFRFSRRGLLAGLGAALGLRVLPGLADDKPPSDRGIGGTGISALPEPGGAIGFVGSIQGFGSIYVNSERIAYPPDVTVTIDGQRRRPADLLIGQVVKTVAVRRAAALWTDRIDVLSEVVGAIEAVDADGLTILGQRIGLGTTGVAGFAVGQRVAVSGFRRADGTIIARLVEPAGRRQDQVVGLAEYRGWTLRIGALQLFGPDARFDGHRVVVRGRRSARGLIVTSIAPDALPDGAGVRRLSIEAYVARSGSDLQLGSGIVVRDRDAAGDQPLSDQPSVVDIDLGSGSVDPRFGGMRPGSGPPRTPDGSWLADTLGKPGGPGMPSLPTGSASPSSWPAPAASLMGPAALAISQGWSAGPRPTISPGGMGGPGGRPP